MQNYVELTARLGISMAMFVLAVSCSSQLPPEGGSGAAPASPTAVAPAPIPSQLPPAVTPSPLPQDTRSPPRDNVSRVVRLEDDGKRVEMRPSDMLSLALGNQYEWQITIDNPDVLKVYT